MALSKNITLNLYGQDVAYNDTYCKVTSLNGSKDEMFATIETYASQGGDFITAQTYSFVPDLSGDNFIAQAYVHIKQQSEFSGATDV